METQYLTKETQLCDQTVRVYSDDGSRWFSRKKDLKRFEAVQARQEQRMKSEWRAKGYITMG